MLKNKIKNLVYLFIIFVFLSFFQVLQANENLNFLSLKNKKVNLRKGPSFEYPVKFIYKKKYLPVLVLDKLGPWRKIKDFESNSGWIHVSQLSKRKSGINKKNNSVIYKNPTIFSKPLAKLETGRLVLISKCRKKWCKVSSGNFSGWILENYLWGKIN